MVTVAVSDTGKHSSLIYEGIPRITTGEVDQPEVMGRDSNGWRWALAALRVSLGLVFLWAFLDKLFGLGYSTPSERAWIHGGSPTFGFLSHVEVGPFQALAHDIAGAWWADWLFMIGLGAIGIALLFGVALRVTAGAGSVMLLMIWAAEWPPARFTADGGPSGSTNPLVDYHIVWAIALIVIALVTDPATTVGGRVWTAIPFVRRHPWLA
jgi:thiosulfate dehydrogenase [quinone] large subunit